MFHLSNQKIIFGFVICLFLSVANVLACGCASQSIEDSVEKSSMIFSGKVVGFEYRKGIPIPYVESREKKFGIHIDYETMVIKVQIEHWWKGEAPTEVLLVTNEARYTDGTGSNSSCDYSFKKGESYLVYAFGRQDELRTHSCMRTQLLTRAGEDLKILGEGKAPVKKKVNPTNYQMRYH